MIKTLLQWIILIHYLNGLVTCEGQIKNLRVVHKLVGGHITLNRDDDSELMTLGTGEGKGTKKTKDKDKEEKKTLAQQVAEGKYALIQTELFSKPIRKPGVISYGENSEVPDDNIGNLGGLNKSDIWLSENHLLVIRGGSYPPYSPQTLEADVWPSIDDYKAPRRQVKLPSRPKVPPPFPVQLEDGGPLLLLGTNATKTLNGSFASPIYPVYGEENYVPGSETPAPGYLPASGGGDQANFTAGQTPFPVPPFTGPGLDYYDPAKEGPLNNGNLPFFSFLGPENLPNLDNDTYDEDDPSIYYPPPYSFYYRQDNSSKVPPGPLVPGIVLPPPPNFFGPLDEDNATKSEEPQVSTTPQPKRITTTSTESILTSKPHRKPTVTPTLSKKYPTITVLKAITTSLPEHLRNDGRPSKVPARTKTVVSTTRVPLKGYYTTTQFEPISFNNRQNKQFLKELVLNIPKLTTSRPPPPIPKEENPSPPAQYYFYGDENSINTTPELRKPNYYIPSSPGEVDVINEQAHPQREDLRYYYLNNPKNDPSRRPADTFSIHIARLKDQIHTFQTVLRNNNNFYRNPPISNNDNYHKPLYRYSFESDYPHRQRIPQNPLRPEHYDIQIQEAIEVTTPTPIYETTQEDTFYYPETVTDNPRKTKGRRGSRPRPSKPISEYSFEATQNPILQQLYTKHDEPYIDDVTKEYFTVFGKKLPVATTPIPAYSEHKYVDTGPERNRPVSLLRDTLINYLHSRPRINPHSEYVSGQKYDGDRIPEQPGYTRDVNYGNSDGKIEENKRPFISYKLPGDEGTHFYFITPKLAQKRQQNTSYFYH